MTSGSASNDGERPSANGEASHDALGDTHLGRSLKELINEIGKQKDALQKGLDSGEAGGTGSQVGEDFDPSQTRFDQALELAVTAPDGTAITGNDAASHATARQEIAASSAAAGAETDPEISQAMSGLETVLRRYAEAERRRYEQQLGEWKVQLKKATMIVIKKQVDTARAKWMQNQSTGEAKIADHYRRLKALADKVARQKAQIQQAKKELEKKLEVADRLHNEFDQIRQVLDGQIGAIDALDKGDEPVES
ncbi:MAG: hypothetical protein BMS9Abin01_2451 [Gammaproteobacteria bacterium]|nr:MAG: hypothetical protein BMS9Abin01_2451 [Gammaproteobacteria bacterium]